MLNKNFSLMANLKDCIDLNEVSKPEGYIEQEVVNKPEGYIKPEGY